MREPAIQWTGNLRDDCTEVEPKFWGCWKHWRSLPKRFQDRIWKAYRRGQEVTKTPSAEYIEVAREVQAWIVEQIKCRQARARNEAQP